MSVAFRRGSTTGPADLDIFIRNPQGDLMDPVRLSYAVYDRTTGIEVLQGSPACVPFKISVGHWYACVVIPADANIGDFVIRWTIQEIPTDPVYQSVMEFNVVGDNTIVSFTGNPDLDRLIWSLRILLRDNQPDKNYSVDGKEKIELMVNGKAIIVSLKELWEIIEKGRREEDANL